MAKESTILFATFSPWEKGKRSPTNGMIEPMVKFFVPKLKRFVLIDEPHPGSSTVLPIIEIYDNGKLTRKTSSSVFINWLYPLLIIRNSVGTRIPFKIRDFLTVLDFALRDKKRYDVFIGLESINALAGILLKKIGLVGKVIYYVSDYSPQRYKAGWFNKIYLTLDKLAATHSDYIWDVSLAMMPARIKAGLNKKNAAFCIHVPNALYPEQINYLSQSKIIPNSLVFAGTLGEENGPDLAIKALKHVLLKINNATLHIYGGGETDLKRLNDLAGQLGVKKSVIFHGFFNDQIKLSEEIRNYSVGLAPYIAIPGSPRWWADATKIRLYLAAGLPVITTQVPPLGKELIENKSGIVANDNVKETAKAIISLLSNPENYKKIRENAIKSAKSNTWDNTYSKAIQKSGIDLL